MKSSYFIISFLFLSSFSIAQERLDSNDYKRTSLLGDNEGINPLNLFLNKTPEQNGDLTKAISNRIDNFCNKLNTHRNKKNFLKYVFYRTHREFLNKYALNSPLYKTFENGNYDCVSGTALFALILEKLNIPYKIKETKFHVYIIANFNNAFQLLETTDPYQGFLDNLDEIRTREKEYLSQTLSAENLYVFKGDIFDEITLTQLAGLEYYNQGIIYFNEKNDLKSLSCFEKALELYKSPRIEEIFKMSLQSLASQVQYSKSVGLAQKYEYYSKLINH
jgi:hypothetical protein